MTRAIALRSNAGTTLRAQPAAFIVTPVPELAAALCSDCGTRPRLAALTRCKPCLQADVQRDREQREARAKEHAETQLPATKSCKTCQSSRP